VKRYWLFFVILFCLKEPIKAQSFSPEPEIERQIVFGVAPFDGTKYLSSFLPETRKTLRFPANADNVITVLLSDVYYWPISAEYRADFQGVHLPLAGKLSIFKGKKLLQELHQAEYIYVYPRGPAGEASRLLRGDEMNRFITDYAAQAGERAAHPDRIYAAYQGPFRGFILNLPAGKYEIVFSVENNEKTFTMTKELTVFSPLGRGFVYQIIPEEKWTISSGSETPYQRIYLKPGGVVYLKIFPTILYRKSDYELMQAPHRPSAGIGLENASLWIHEEMSLEEMPGPSLRMTAGGHATVLAPRDFIVQQQEGYALGYRVLEYEQTRFPNSRPAFKAYRLTAPPPGTGVMFRVPESGRETVRHLRTLKPEALCLSFLSLLLPFLPVLLRFRLKHLENRRAKFCGKKNGKRISAAP
jgi:hypothetical protein